jgi:hypothetical protein
MMYGPTPEQAAAQGAVFEIRQFLLINRGLGHDVFKASLLLASGYEAPNPEQLVIDAMRQHSGRDPLCAAILGPWGQAALAALAWEFPEWRPVFAVLTAAAQTHSQARDRANASAALWTVAILGVAGVLAAALSGRKGQGLGAAGTDLLDKEPTS